MSNKTFNIYKFLERRPLSWSAYDCFTSKDWGNPEKWYRRYILGEKEPPSPQLLFGSKVDKQIQNDPTFLPELERFPNMQFRMEVVYKKINLIGYADGWDEKKRLKDDKTGETPWTKKRADETGQLTYYLAMIYLMYGIRPEEVELQIDWLPTIQNADLSISFVKDFKVQTFKTKRTMVDVLKMLANIEKTCLEMQKYVRNHK